MCSFTETYPNFFVSIEFKKLGGGGGGLGGPVLLFKTIFRH